MISRIGGTVLVALLAVSGSTLAQRPPRQTGANKQAPGGATGPRYEVVVRESTIGGEATRQVQASCPAGKKALGAGWAALDPTGAILEGRHTYFEPTYDASGWLVNAQKVSTFAPTWKLRVRTVCGSAG